MSVSLWSTCSVSCLSDRTGIKGMHCDVDVVNPFRRWNLPSCDIFVFKITISVFIWFRTLEMHSSQWLFLQFTLAFSAQILWCLNVKIASSISVMLSCIASWENILCIMSVWTQPVVQLVGWTMQMSPAKRHLSYDVIRLTCSKVVVWTVNDVARLMES